MDANVAGAITAVQLDSADQLELWFRTIRQTNEQLGEPTWEQFAETLPVDAESAGIGRDVADGFIEYLNANTSAPMDTVLAMVEYGDSLPELHTQLVAEGEPADEGYDEAAWQEFLAEYGPRWDGDESSWEGFKQWFLYTADQQGLAVPANQFVIYVENQQDKVATFEQYGVRLATAEPAEAEASPDLSTYPEIQEGDSGEWVDYLDAMLKSKGF
jgi:hypothetical protein